MLRKTSLRGVFAAAVFVGGTVAAAGSASADQGELAFGGRLYDDWTKMTSGMPPAKPHGAIPADNKKLKKKAVATWRCKTCHGWDYRGVDGAYGLKKKSKYYTQIKGVNGAAGKSADDVLGVMKDGTHGYTEMMMPANEMKAVAAFVAQGQVDMTKYINDDKSLKAGDTAKGKVLYDALCATCHGFDGRKISGMDALAYEVKKNPWEGLHKILNGQPKENMVAMRALPVEMAVDVLAYAFTLPDEGMHAGEKEGMDAFLAANVKLDAVKDGDAAKGKDLYGTLCQGCHGMDGKKDKDVRMKAKRGTLGAEVNKDPVTALNKILNGQFDKGMVSMRALPEQMAHDVLAYAKTLPAAE